MIDAIRHALGRIFFFLRSSQLEKDFSSEMSTHLELAIEENLKLGMSPAEARRTVRTRGRAGKMSGPVRPTRSSPSGRPEG